jgi:hypothetical protein
MKQFFSVLFLFVLVSGLSFAQDAYDRAEKQTTPVVPIILGEPQYEAPVAVLYDNGPLVNAPGGGFGGADASVLQTALGLGTYGFGHQVANTNSVADDFTVGGSGWQVDEMQFFAYQTNSTTTSTITDVRVQIWNGDPQSGGTIIFGDLTTNRLASTTWSNIYRSIDTDPLASNRPIMVQTVTIGTTLAPGTYWVQWMTGGSLASGPWAPPITINGLLVTGNGLQNLAGTWQAALDGTNQQGFPFIVIGSEVGGAEIFTDNFDSYTAGQLLACQNPVDWTTWSNAPCGPEDALISTNYAYSGANSFLIVQNDDLVKPLGNKTTGKWYMSFLFYIPAGKSGYFNQLTGFTPDPFEWGCDAYFDLGGGGRLDITGGGGGGTVVNFNWVVAQWNQVVLIVDLDSPTHDAQFWIGTSPSTLTLVSTWDWTNGGLKANRIAADDFFGAAATDEMYVDNYYFGDAMPPIIPVELTSFTANVNTLGQVVLNWETATEINNQGFEIERRTESSEFRTIGFIEGHGSTTETQSYIYTDVTAENGINYYRLKQIDYNGTYSYSDEVEVDVTSPLTFDLAQNYPNPFNPSTSIKYSVPESGNIRLSVFNIVGEEVAVLANGFSQAGSFEVTFDATNLSTGVYLYKLQSANSVQTKKMMLLK